MPIFMNKLYIIKWNVAVYFCGRVNLTGFWASSDYSNQCRYMRLLCVIKVFKTPPLYVQLLEKREWLRIACHSAIHGVVHQDWSKKKSIPILINAI